jgi:hypothetical protein
VSIEMLEVIHSVHFYRVICSYHLLYSTSDPRYICSSMWSGRVVEACCYCSITTHTLSLLTTH